jgi:16S rRNA (guanine527-N7)-methyltransferase
MLDAARIAELLRPFADVPDELANRLRTYLDLLLRWNARMNLTAVRDPEEIVTRHFGESLFAARVLRDAGAFASESPTLSDIGSGAGFPGIPIKLAQPEIHLTLIESQNKKATFLREVVRALELTDAEVFFGRAETRMQTSNVVTVRAVENFDRTLPVAAGLVAPAGTLGLLLGSDQVGTATALLGAGWRFYEPLSIPTSRQRVVVVAKKT